MINKKHSKQQFSWLWVVLGLIIIGIIIALILLNGNSNAKGLPEAITVQEASERLAKGAYLLDVREQSEWNDSHVDGAHLIPLGELMNRVSEIPKDQDVLIICRSGNRSATARDLLRGDGYERTTSISGGITAWISAGLPVVSGP
jgi:rhodanese-related sulfurtransferase